MDESNQSTHVRTSTGVHLPRFLLEPQSLSSKKDRERRNLRYVPPAPRPHYVRSAPSQTRLIHSRLGNDSHDLDNSFQLLMSGASGGGSSSYFRATFDIQERLGFGSFGDVFRVKDKVSQREFAVKKSRRVITGEGDKARQLREVNRMIGITPNPHLVDLEMAWEEEGHLFFQLELCLKSLNQEIEEMTSFPVEQAWDVLIDMLYALEHLHKNRLVHMDVKPDNIFISLDSPRKYKLGDFGIIVCLNENYDLSEFTEGDSRYLAPEVMQGVASTKADVFSLGLTILEISCNVDLPKGGTLWHQLRNGELPEPSNRLVPNSLKSIILKMITSDPNKRPEIEEVVKMPDVEKHIAKRRWTHRIANVQQRFEVQSKKDNTEGAAAMELGRRTPEPLLRDAPNLLLNDSSFSDDDEVKTKSPVFASTPISISKLRSGGSSRLRSSRLHRLGNGEDEAIRPVGSPTSRNLLKEFDAVSE